MRGKLPLKLWSECAVQPKGKFSYQHPLREMTESRSAYSSRPAAWNGTLILILSAASSSKEARRPPVTILTRSSFSLFNHHHLSHTSLSLFARLSLTHIW